MTLDHFTIIQKELGVYREDILRLWSKEWWTKDRSAEDLIIALTNSTFVFGLLNVQTNKLIGFARVLSDQFKYAYVYDFIIDPSFRGQKLSKYLLNRILEHPTISKMLCVELVCRSEMIPYYEQFGFSTDYSPSVAMRKLRSN